MCDGGEFNGSFWLSPLYRATPGLVTMVIVITGMTYVLLSDGVFAFERYGTAPQPPDACVLFILLAKRSPINSSRLWL
jgi:hypothetical protein